MQKNGRKNNSFFPPPITSPFHIELDKTVRGFSLSCSGVKGISEFSDTEIKIKLSGFSILISGSGLYMTVFEDKCIEIIGKFSEVRFLYGKN